MICDDSRQPLPLLPSWSSAIPLRKGTAQTLVMEWSELPVAMWSALCWRPAGPLGGPGSGVRTGVFSQSHGLFSKYTQLS